MAPLASNHDAAQPIKWLGLIDQAPVFRADHWPVHRPASFVPVGRSLPRHRRRQFKSGSGDVLCTCMLMRGPKRSPPASGLVAVVATVLALVNINVNAARPSDGRKQIIRQDLFYLSHITRSFVHFCRPRHADKTLDQSGGRPLAGAITSSRKNNQPAPQHWLTNGHIRRARRAHNGETVDTVQLFCFNCAGAH